MSSVFLVWFVVVFLCWGKGGMRGVFVILGFFFFLMIEMVNSHIILFFFFNVLDSEIILFFPDQFLLSVLVGVSLPLSFWHLVIEKL